MTIPMRHGLTVGELARLANTELELGAQLQVLPMEGWQRQLQLAETGLPWVAPSPNMPRLETTLVYPGQVLLEGTLLSEGRGTTQPFEMAGAPFVEAYDLCQELQRYPTPGLAIRPVRFRPTFDKWQQASCGGVALHVVQPHEVRSYRTTLSLLAAVHHLWPSQPLWRPPPYEYETEQMPIDLLHGSPQLRLRFARGAVHRDDIADLAAVDAAAWWARVAPALLYEEGTV